MYKKKIYIYVVRTGGLIPKHIFFTIWHQLMRHLRPWWSDVSRHQWSTMAHPGEHILHDGALAAGLASRCLDVPWMQVRTSGMHRWFPVTYLTEILVNPSFSPWRLGLNMVIHQPRGYQHCSFLLVNVSFLLAKLRILSSTFGSYRDNHMVATGVWKKNTHKHRVLKDLWKPQRLSMA